MHCLPGVAYKLPLRLWAIRFYPTQLNKFMMYPPYSYYILLITKHSSCLAKKIKIKIDGYRNRIISFKDCLNFIYYC